MKLNFFTSVSVFFLIFCGLFFLGQLQRLEIFGWPAFYIHDVVLGLWGLWILIAHKKEIFKLISKLKFKSKKLELFLLAWIFLGWLVAELVGNLDGRFIFYVLRFLTYGFVFFSIYKFKLIKKEFLKSGYFLVGFTLLIIGFFQYFLIPDTRFLNAWGWDDHFYRLMSTQFDPNFMGILLVLLFINFKNFKSKISQNLKYFLLFLVLIGISLTFSRASFLSFGLVLILDAGIKFKNYLWGILLLILIILSPKPGGEGVDLMRTASVIARVESSQKAIFNLNSYQYILGRGLFSNGSDDLSLVNRNIPDHAYLDDNLILLIFNATGIVGLSLVLFLGAKYLRQLYSKNKIGFLSVIAIFIHAMFNNTLFQPFVFLYLIWGIIGFED